MDALTLFPDLPIVAPPPACGAYARCFDGDELRAGIDRLTSREAISDWRALALEEGIDPL